MFIRMWLITMDTLLNFVLRVTVARSSLIGETFDFTIMNLTQVRNQCKVEFNSLDKIN